VASARSRPAFDVGLWNYGWCRYGWLGNDELEVIKVADHDVKIEEHAPDTLITTFRPSMLTVGFGNTKITVPSLRTVDYHYGVNQQPYMTCSQELNAHATCPALTGSFNVLHSQIWAPQRFSTSNIYFTFPSRQCYEAKQLDLRVVQGWMRKQSMHFWGWGREDGKIMPHCTRWAFRSLSKS